MIVSLVPIEETFINNVQYRFLEALGQLLFGCLKLLQELLASLALRVRKLDAFRVRPPFWNRSEIAHFFSVSDGLI